MTPDEYELWKFNGCTRKVPYTSKDKAERAARRRRQATGLAISAYECDFSGAGRPHYHIGRKKKTAAQKAILNDSLLEENEVSNAGRIGPPASQDRVT